MIFGADSEPHRQIVRMLLAKGAKPDVADSDGITPLMVAAAVEETVILLHPPCTCIRCFSRDITGGCHHDD